MQTIDVFGHTIVKTSCGDKSLYATKTVVSNLESLIKLANQKAMLSKRTVPSIVGNIETTDQIFQHKLNPLNIKFLAPLNKWISDQLLCCAKHFVDYPVADVSNIYSWANIMFSGSQVKVHSHKYTVSQRNPDCVAIFYVKAFADSANLTFVDPDHGDQKSGLLDDYAAEHKHQICAVDGDMIVHSPALPHGVSVHTHDTPRICLVVDAKFVAL